MIGPLGKLAATAFNKLMNAGIEAEKDELREKVKRLETVIATRDRTIAKAKKVHTENQKEFKSMLRKYADLENENRRLKSKIYELEARFAVRHLDDNPY